VISKGMRLSLALAAACVSLCGCNGKEKAIVHLRYELQPDRGFPPGVTGLAVAQLEAKSDSEEALDEAKWQEIVGEMMHRRLTIANEKYGLGLTIADRASTKEVMTEKDLALSGLAEGGDVAARTKLVGVQALIRGRVIIKVEKHIGRGRTIKALDVSGYGGHGWGGGGGGIDTEETTSVSRTVTVHPSFRLVDANTGKDWFTWTPERPFQQSDQEKPSFFFGSGKTEADLDPRDRIIAQCVEEAVAEFTSHLIPVEIDCTVEVRSSGNKACAMGVKYLRAEDYETALASFKQALADQPDDDRAAFCAGVACEKMGQWDDALQYYNQALVSKDEPEYKDARDRVKKFKDRVGPGAEATHSESGS